MVGTGTTTTTALLKAAKELLGRNFTGVYPSDKVPHNFKSVIANLDSSKQGGSHWIAIAKKKKGNYLVYDSFGRPTRKIIRLKHATQDADYDAEQADHEENCGARCIAWLLVFYNHGEKAAQLI